jgi:hypothetical protein
MRNRIGEPTLVWGMERIGSGIYGPHGTFPGEIERLNDLGRELSDEERAKFKPHDYGFAIYERLLKDIGPLADHELPRMFVASERPKALGSLIRLAWARAVDQKLKDIIERLEPGVHQFWPLQIVMPNGDEYPVQYYGMMVLRRLSSFRPDQSDPSCFLGQQIAPGIRSYSSYGVSKKINAGLAMSKAVLNGSHIWRERELTNPTLVLSDDLVAEIKKAGLKIPKHFPLKEV